MWQPNSVLPWLCWFGVVVNQCNVHFFFFSHTLGTAHKNSHTHPISRTRTSKSPRSSTHRGPLPSDHAEFSLPNKLLRAWAALRCPQPSTPRCWEYRNEDYKSKPRGSAAFNPEKYFHYFEQQHIIPSDDEKGARARDNPLFRVAYVQFTPAALVAPAQRLYTSPTNVQCRGFHHG